MKILPGNSHGFARWRLPSKTHKSANLFEKNLPFLYLMRGENP